MVDCGRAVCEFGVGLGRNRLLGYMPGVVLLEALIGLVGYFRKFGGHVALAEGEFCHT
jgi:hypothetical protein